MQKKYKIIVAAALALLLIYLSIPLPNPVFEEDYSAVILAEHNEILRVFLNKNEQWCFPPDELRIIPKKLEQSVLFYEDQYFYWHPGFNPVAILRALSQNISGGEVVSGASTITMQVARLMRPKPRTYLNKILEILQSVKLETRYSKNEILKLYLDHAPYGGNIIGYQAAALRFYNRFPDQLTWGQAATLAVLPNAPGLVSPQTDPVILKDKRNRLLARMKEAGIIDPGTFELACLENIPDQSIPTDFLAPHLGNTLTQNHPEKFIFPTTINKKLQQTLEQIVKQHGDILAIKGINNLAALVTDTQSGAVKAYIGSNDFFASRSNGQVDGVQAARSSGSILKPFLYALSMDEGYLLPKSLIKDVPSFYGSFSPSNADLKYRGIVTVQTALTHSLNVPAVRTLYQYGYRPFYFFLKEAGVSTLFRQYADYGLSLILGGAETSLWDMAALYRGLGLYGRFSPIHVLVNDSGKTASGKTLISPGSCYLTLTMLNELNRPGSEYYWQQYQNQWPLAWKTGTSYGQRDGWAIGVSPQWTIAVWVGNFDGQGNAELSGAGCAGPVFFDIFNALPKNPETSWFNPPEMDLQEVQVCRATGYLAGPDCSDPVATSAPRLMKPMKICPWHTKLFVNQDETEQVCSLCWERENYHVITKLIYPPDVSQYLRRNGQVVESLPPHRKSCPAQAGGNPLQIIYPQQNASLYVPRDFDGALQKVNLKAGHQQKDCTIYWYLDDQFKGTTAENHELPIELTKGWHRLEVIDESGNTANIRFYANLRE